MSATLHQSTVDGFVRDWLLHEAVPETPGSVDLVIACHAETGTGLDSAQSFYATHWARQESRGFWLAAPQAKADWWTPPEPAWTTKGAQCLVPGVDEARDERFIAQMIADIATIATAQGITLASVYITGHGGGARMAYHMGLVRPDLIAGFGGHNRDLPNAMWSMTPTIVRPAVVSHGDAAPSWNADACNKGALVTRSKFESWESATPPGSPTTLAGPKITKKYAYTAPAGKGLWWYRVLGGGKNLWPHIVGGFSYNLDDQVVAFWEAHAGLRVS